MRFTVFTPTYNRAHTLLRPYESLCAQHFRDFEWLIVDDGSSDQTDELVEGWIAEGRLNIRYLRQENGGKHRAFNHGVREAAGELFVPLDSDDWCTPDALERFDFHWGAIPEAQRGNFSGVGCLCRDEYGNPVGKGYPEAPLDASLLDLLRQQALIGEKWGCHRTELLRQHPFPEYPGERFVPEALVWNRLARQYRMRFVNEGLRIYARSDDGLMAASLSIRVNSPQGARQYYLEAARLPLGMKNSLAAWLNYGRFAAHAGLSLWQTSRQGGHLWALPASLIGRLLARRDRRLLAGGRRG